MQTTRSSTPPVKETRSTELFSEERSADVVAASFEGTGDARLREIMTALARHLHAFVKDIEPTIGEWAKAIEFLTETGQMCSPVRQEFILLSDVLGVSMLVDAINNRANEATESTVEGPFHVVDSPHRELGADIALDGKGEPCLVTGKVTDVAGDPIPGATVDVWQANDDGFYDVQQPGLQPERNLRGLFTVSTDGTFWFRSIVPRYYPIPNDGPVGRLLTATGRHPNRPAHIHFDVEADGFRSLVTHLFVADTPYVDSDAVFGVKESLLREFPLVDDEARAVEFGLPNPFRTVHFDVVLRSSDGNEDTEKEARP